MSVAFGVYRWLEDRVGQRDGCLQVRRTGAPQGLVPREFGSGKIHLFQTIHRDDCEGKHTEAESEERREEAALSDDKQPPC